jgi:23S rRNA pseudouridine1911/1915/1917 synthase
VDACVSNEVSPGWHELQGARQDSLPMSRLRASDVSFVRPPDVVEGSVVSVLRVPPEVAGRRLDVFVHGELHRTSRTRAQAIVRASAYDASGRRLRPSDRVQPEQRILLWRPPWDEKAVPIDVPTIWEDEHLLAVAKPALLPVHPTARYHRNTLIKVLQTQRPECAFLALGHRLDRETSGVLIVSKTRACDRALKKLFERRAGVQKSYVAITWGVPDRGDGSKRFRYERSMELDKASPLGVKMRLSDSPQALRAATGIDVKDVRRGPSESLYSLVHCELETGRQHQIRLHLASLGAPVVGDKLYGPDEQAFARAADGRLTEVDLLRLELPRHALHAWRLALPHPIAGTQLVLEAPLPDDITGFWASLEGCPQLTAPGE